jgi:transposase InsO family protein
MSAASAPQPAWMAVLDRWFTVAELAGLPGLPGTSRGVAMRADAEQWQRRRRAVGYGYEFAFDSLPAATKRELINRSRAACKPEPTRPAEDIQAAWQRFDAAKQHQKDEARRRLNAVHAVQLLVANGLPMMQARERVAAQMAADGELDASPVSIARWQDRIKGAAPSDRLALLLPDYKGRPGKMAIEADAWEILKADYLRVEQPTLAACYDRLQRIARQRGWTLPSIRTFQRRLDALPPAMRVLAREGDEALARTYPAQERDRTLMRVLEGVNADGHRWDVMVRMPDGVIARPAIVAWQDLRSGKILSWRLCDQESSDVVRLSFADMVRQYGVPEHVWLDNGRAFASKWITGGTRTRYRFKVKAEDPAGIITSLVGAEGVHWVTPYHGQAKPIERAWRDFCDRIARHPAFAGAYTGNSPVTKPENYGSRAIAWADFERVVVSEIHAHNARPDRRSATAAGRSFDAVFAEGYAQIVPRRASDEQLRHLMLATEAVTADADSGSVRLAGNRYWTEALTAHAGRRVVLRVDPHHLQGEAHVYALDGTFIATAPCVARVGFADVEAAREHQRARRQHRRAAKDLLAAERRMDAAQVAAQLPDTPPPDLPAAPVVAPIFGRHFERPQQPAAAAATGTEGPTKLDLWLLEQQKKRADEAL